MTIFETSAPVFGLLLAVFGVGRLLTAPARRVLPTVAGMVVAAGLGAATSAAWRSILRPAGLGVLAAVFLLGLCMGLSIGVAFGVASGLFLAVSGIVPLTVLPSRMESGVEGFVLLAVPLFIVVGAMMNASGISERIVGFLRTLVGHVRGGLVSVVAMYLFLGIY